MTVRSEQTLLNDVLVEPGSRVRLSDYKSDVTFGLTKPRVAAIEKKLDAEMAELQEMLYAAHRHAVLIILQGMDTSGKDGAIKKVLDPVTPTGVRVQAFKKPTSYELSHDFLWRVHRMTPELGMIGIFNRSHYEDVLIVRVHDLVPRAKWKLRYRHINEFERMLCESDTIVLKFFLNISREEQEQRLLEREQEATKAWKLAVADWQEREHWDEYMEAYEEAISRTSTERAPWHIIPSDKKWVRNHVLSEVIVNALRPYREQWAAELDVMGRTALEDIRAFRAEAEAKATASRE